MCYWAVHYLSADCQDQAALLPFFWSIHDFHSPGIIYMHVCKETFIGCFRTITSLIHWAYTIFNWVQIYRFLDSPTQKCSISKSVKYFTLHPDIKLSLFSTGKWLVLKYKRREEEEVISLYSFHNLMSRDLQNLRVEAVHRYLPCSFTLSALYQTPWMSLAVR